VASECGFTPQYAGLEELYRRHRDAGFVGLGFPCDQFGHQEPGDEAAISAFCAERYDVTFPHRDGEVVHRFASATTPAQIERSIVSLLGGTAARP
jgi:glutathione peroxidase-family protein